MKTVKALLILSSLVSLPSFASAEKERTERAREEESEAKHNSEARIIYEAIEQIQAQRTDVTDLTLIGAPSNAEQLLQEAFVSAVLDNAAEKVEEAKEEKK